MRVLICVSTLCLFLLRTGQVVWVMHTTVVVVEGVEKDVETMVEGVLIVKLGSKTVKLGDG